MYNSRTSEVTEYDLYQILVDHIAPLTLLPLPLPITPPPPPTPLPATAPLPLLPFLAAGAAPFWCSSIA